MELEHSIIRKNAKREVRWMGESGYGIALHGEKTQKKRMKRVEAGSCWEHDPQNWRWEHMISMMRVDDDVCIRAKYILLHRITATALTIQARAASDKRNEAAGHATTTSAISISISAVFFFFFLARLGFAARSDGLGSVRVRLTSQFSCALP
jgi:hypothetical protein